jgi:hypothetical protein
MALYNGEETVLKITRPVNKPIKGVRASAALLKIEQGTHINKLKIGT